MLGGVYFHHSVTLEERKKQEKGASENTVFATILIGEAKASIGSRHSHTKNPGQIPKNAYEEEAPAIRYTKPPQSNRSVSQKYKGKR